MKTQILKTRPLYFLLVFVQVITTVSFAQNKTSEKWTIRYNDSKAETFFKTHTTQRGLTFTTSPLSALTGDMYAYYHLKLDTAVKAVTFNYAQTGDATSVPITLLDAAANELWRYDGKGTAPKTVALKI
ncbi:hypothetical protein ACFFU9_11300 [Mariniflexile ostreae]|uniref:Uncharacterized protein n=1 Tax=Mariniflexile ostreae TaxID=1520892 RepID=A0ABV5FCZ9_9FLAO